MEMAMLNLGIVNEAIPVIETTITIGAETIPASTAACPITNAPKILTACPTIFGSLTPASLNASNDISIIKASTKAGKGIASLDEAILNKRLVGIIS
jgi:hypothetical protein